MVLLLVVLFSEIYFVQFVHVKICFCFSLSIFEFSIVGLVCVCYGFKLISAL